MKTNNKNKNKMLHKEYLLVCYMYINNIVINKYINKIRYNPIFLIAFIHKSAAICL